MTSEKQAASLSERLDALFEQIPNPATGRRYSYPEAAAKIAGRVADLSDDERRARTISSTYIWQLVKGRRANPTIGHLESLADLFGMPVNVLVDQGGWETLQSELEYLGAVRDSNVRDVANRVRGLSTGSLNALRAFIDHARTLEGLSDNADTDSAGSPDHPGG